MYGRMISCNVSGPLAADHAWRTQQFFCLPGAVGQLQLLPNGNPLGSPYLREVQPKGFIYDSRIPRHCRGR